MNPFDLTGPQFLLFYLLFGVIVCYWLNYGINQFDNRYETPPASLASDPYLIAYLRAGGNEATQIATLSLVDRGILKESDGKLTLMSGFYPGLVQRPIEAYIVERYSAKSTPQAPIDSLTWSAPIRQLRNTLARYGLVKSMDLLSKRVPLALLAWGLLLGVSHIRLDLAAQRGHANTGFLMALSLFFSVYVLLLLFKATRRRREFLKNLETLFQRLKQRAAEVPAGGASNEMALLAAIFGVGVLSAATFPYCERLYPSHPAGGSGGDGGGGDSTSSDSSSGDSSGGGCGGCGGGGD
jgi:uncharacterized protein (TIGR04222 family)